MSHYCVLVIGDDVEGQLAPFDENMVVDRYVQYTREQLIANGRESVMQYLRGYYLDYMRDPAKYVSDCMQRMNTSADASLDPADNRHLEYLRFEYPLKWKWTDEQVYAEEIEFQEPEDIGPDGEVYSTYNPKSKWDWYETGGRYAGRLWLNPGAALAGRVTPNFAWGFKHDERGLEAMAKILANPRTDSAHIKDLDWSRMHQDPKVYEDAMRFWDMMVNGAEPVTDEEKRYMEFQFYTPKYYTSRYKTAETYATCTANFTAWAYVKDGEWFEKGKMGWFGMSGESDADAVKWELEFYDRVIQPLDPETRITVMDCHI